MLGTHNLSFLWLSWHWSYHITTLSSCERVLKKHVGDFEKIRLFKLEYKLNRNYWFFTADWLRLAAWVWNTYSMSINFYFLSLNRKRSEKQNKSRAPSLVYRPIKMRLGSHNSDGWWIRLVKNYYCMWSFYLLVYICITLFLTEFLFLSLPDYPKSSAMALLE